MRHWRHLLALLRLALRALVLHPLQVVFVSRASRGKARFLQNYAVEGLVPYSADERAALPGFSGCVNCGLCDAVCPILSDSFRGPSLFALAFSRATPELRALRAAVGALDGCGTCRLCQQTCPRAVPLLDIFAFTRRKLAEVDAALPPASAPAPAALEPRLAP
jgi:succinate dehydrogenase/fumarate reductase-like Fe-S protein